MLKSGDTAPSFALMTDSGATIRSSDLSGKRYVLYFYPKDDTPGCTKEACSFRDNLPAFDRLNVPVFGLSADDDKAHAKFVKKYSLNFPLLSDPDHTLLEAYGAWVEKSMYGRSYFGIQRSTFVIDASGKIEKVWEKVKPEGHAEEVMQYLRGEANDKAPATTPTGKTKPNASKKATSNKKVAGKNVTAKKVIAKKTTVKVKKTVVKKTSSKTTTKKVAVKKIAAKKAVAKSVKKVSKKITKKKNT